MTAWSEVVRGMRPRLNDRPTLVDPARIPARSGTPSSARASNSFPITPAMSSSFVLG